MADSSERPLPSLGRRFLLGMNRRIMLLVSYMEGAGHHQGSFCPWKGVIYVATKYLRTYQFYYMALTSMSYVCCTLSKAVISEICRDPHYLLCNDEPVLSGFCRC